MKQFLGIRAHTDGAYRAEKLFDKDYIVVPVVALVEGVLMGMSAKGPELALAEEFGRFPDGWNGRPVVMSHPVSEGTPISANSPGVLVDYHLGALYNTKLVGNQLKQEAWLEVSRLETLNDDSKTLLANLKANKPIEVSTGYFSQIEETAGVYNGKDYIAIQRNIVPDHLALLPEGTLGACNNDDGCGINVNAVFRVNCPDCSGTCGDTKTPSINKPAVLTAQAAKKAKMAKGEKDDPKAYEAIGSTGKLGGNADLAAVRSVLANSIPGGMFTCDIEGLVRDALRLVQGYSYLIGITSEKAIYEQYNQFTGYYSTYQRSYSVGADGIVTLGSDVQEVELITQILPVDKAKLNVEGSKPEGAQPKDNEESTMTEANAKKKVDKEDQVDGGADDATENPDGTKKTKANEGSTHKMSSEAGDLEVTVGADGKPSAFAFTPKAPAKVEAHSLDALLANASPALKESIEQGVKLHAAKKTALIAQLEATKRCGFDNKALSAMSIDMLENLAKLADVDTASYAGVASPTANQDESDDAPPAPTVFEVNADGTYKVGDAA